MGNMWWGYASEGKSNMIIVDTHSKHGYGQRHSPFDDEYICKIQDLKIIEETYWEYISEDGSLYKGEKKNGVRDGYGIITWPNGSAYIGYWSMNIFNGKGELRHANGDVFIGNFLNGKPNGYGVYNYKDGTIYVGDWKDGLQHGKGKETKPDGSTYNGDFVMGKKQGKGMIQWSDNSYYEGDWLSNEQQGKGVYVSPNGGKYTGEFFVIKCMVKDSMIGVMELHTLEIFMKIREEDMVFFSGVKE